MKKKCKLTLMINNCVKILSCLLFFVLSFVKVAAQNNFYQDIFYGGVTGGGGNLVIGSGNIEFEIYIEPNSTIKKAFLLFSADGTPEDINIDINSNSLLINPNTIVTSDFLSLYNAPYPSSVNCIDVSYIIDPTVSDYIIQLPIQNISTNEYYSCFYLVVIYENYSLNKTCFNIMLNDKDVSANINYSTNNLCPINNSLDVGLALSTKQFCNVIDDGTSVFVNSNNIGMIGGIDINNSVPCSGVQGHFYYQNNALNGLSDDMANSTMNETDAIANVQTYISNYQTEFLVDFIYQTPSWGNGSKSNPIVASFLTYTTPCDTFATTLTEQVNVCKGEQVQLEATGGIAYEWLPQVGLSCYNCPNPVATADTINYYTCRIWNTDSCSKVLPVKINIIEPPQIQELTTYATSCGDTVGHVNINAGGNIYYNYILNDTLSQPNPHIYFLSAGNHIVSVVDTNGCRTDSAIYIASINNVSAQFSATPQEGEIPVEVTFSNQSTGATDYIWYIGEDTLYSENATYLFETGGEYNVTFVAIDNYPFCSDTATQTITAITPFYIFAPTLTEKDGISYEIKILNTSSLTYSLYNELGQLVYHQSFENLSDGVLSLWDKSKVSRGIYLFSIEATSHVGEKKSWNGKVVVM